MQSCKWIAYLLLLACWHIASQTVVRGEGVVADTLDAPAGAPTVEQLEQWLADLDSDLYAQREQATDAMLAANREAVPYLQRAAHGESLEAADRAVWVLRQLADSPEQQLQLAALEVLVAADRFPTIARDAQAALAELQSELCSKRFVELGAEFVMRPANEYAGTELTTTMNIKVNTNREEWTGASSDLLLITKLRQVGKLTLASELVDDELVAKFAAIDGLNSLTLIETQVSGEMIEKLKKQKPDMRLIVHTRAKLGVRFFDGQPLNITEVQADSPAMKAGLKAGDRVIKFAGVPVETFDRLTALIAQHPPEKNVNITVERGNKELTLTAKLGGTDWWEELKDH